MLVSGSPCGARDGALLLPSRGRGFKVRLFGVLSVVPPQRRPALAACLLVFCRRSCPCVGTLAGVAPDPAALDLRFPVSLGCRCLFQRDPGLGASEAASPPACIACRCLDGLSPGGPDLRLLQFLACRRRRVPSCSLHRPPLPCQLPQPWPPRCPTPRHVQGSRVQRGSPLVMVVL